MDWSLMPYVVHCCLLMNLWLLLLFHFPSHTALPQCNPDDSSALLQFNNSLAIETFLSPYWSLICESSASNKTARWEMGRNCCEWDGVTCDAMSGHVIGLDLSCSNLQGTLHPNSTLFHLTHLQHLNLASNDFSNSLLHAGFGNLVSLTHLNLSSSFFHGDTPSTISHLSKLVSLDLSVTNLRFDASTWNKLILNATNLEELVLDYVDMSSIKEDSLSLLINLSSSLVSLHLGSTLLEGTFPRDVFCLPKLQELSLSNDQNLTGKLPKSNWTVPLRFLDLSYTTFSSEIPDSIGHLKSLQMLSLSGCQFEGLIPPSIWNLTQLTFLDLFENNLNGEIPSLLSNLKHLTFLDFALNNFSGHIPDSLFELKNLNHLRFSSTNLSGHVNFHQFSKFKYLDSLQLSNNRFLSININESIDYTFPKLTDLNLSNSNIIKLPKFIARLHNLTYLDLSNNNIPGKIPKWFSNSLLLSWKNIAYIDLSFNKLQGDLPVPPHGVGFFSVSNNKLTGEISSKLCNTTSLYLLNLSHNNFTGMIPQCLGTFPNLKILDLHMNNFYGSIPQHFSKSNVFETIKLNGNLLDGPLSQSLTHCTNLEVLDLADNYIRDMFPSWLETLPKLKVLILRANEFHGIITSFNTKQPFPELRIFDVSNNNFSGPLPTLYFKNFRRMMNVDDSQSGYIGSGYLYYDSVVVVMKGQFMDLKRILTIFTIIDLSNNKFEGEIPQLIGELNSLRGLNLSHNVITGTIPQSLGNLRSLESLDLSWNQLNGEIPMTLTNLNFLSALNLSQNQLEGTIPTGKQFNTFQNDSYEGNPMLCGFPLSKSCNSDEKQPPNSTFHHEEKFGFGWTPVAVGYACGMVFGMVLGYYCLFLSGKPLWLARLVGLPETSVKRTNNRAHANRRRMN